jgi:hypothetical protein
MFPIKYCWQKGDGLLPLILNFDLEYAIGRDHGKQDGLKLNGKHQLLVYVDDGWKHTFYMEIHRCFSSC